MGKSLNRCQGIILAMILDSDMPRKKSYVSSPAPTAASSDAILRVGDMVAYIGRDEHLQRLFAGRRLSIIGAAFNDAKSLKVSSGAIAKWVHRSDLSR